MLKSERQDALARLTDELRTLTVRDAAERLDISEMTVRRDFDELAEQGRVRRVRGGARTCSQGRSLTISREFTRTEKQLLHVEEKRAIGRAAAELVDEGDTLFLGNGTTVEAMAAELPDCRLRIVTNSLPIFSTLDERADIELFLLGGLYRPGTGALVGPIAEEALANMGLAKAFVGVNGIHENKAFASNMEACALQRAALEAADRRYLLADASKFDRRDFFSFYDLDDLTAIVSDPGLADEARASAEQYTTVLGA